ncbi:Kelch domain-containing protein 3 [Gracilariopsis chorda]|uniref:Kelch domain-containing protein 3 n=1 Tax=Gracilariopsis chorda TaxID=448386 RepID=A0A2V3ID37_9FLOR|nr:Kelch domain-containing protein 3 [Gracilariopsis chorda]|eukprot:PXF40005.1 Kelch domain-containing protein 3 [Gracilariopsis chorda]
MGVCRYFDLLGCAGKPLGSSGSSAAGAQCQVSAEEAATGPYIPAEGISAALISPHRLLVTGGVLDDERVLPFTVLRYLDLDPRSDHFHKWTKPTLLKTPSQRANTAKRARRAERQTTIPVCRMEHTLTMVPDNSRLYLIGGMKVGGRDGGKACTTIFAFDTRSKSWDNVEPEKPSGRVKEDPDSHLGPRFAHSATYVTYTPKCSSARQQARAKPSPYIYVYGGFKCIDDHLPVADMHVFDVKNCRWTLQRPAPGIEPPHRAYHAAALTPSGKYIAVHGGNTSDLNDTYAMTEDLYLFDIQAVKWLKPVVHANSDDVPLPRRRHSLVAGVGRHHGSLVLYGGYLLNDRHSNDMYLCKILEPDLAHDRLEVLWERIGLVPDVSRPLPCDSQHNSEKRASESAAVSGGCLVAIPEMGKYVMVGGRGGYGIRNAPLMLDPGESDEMVISQSMQPIVPIVAERCSRSRLSHAKPADADAPRSPHSPQEGCNGLNDEPVGPIISEGGRESLRSHSPAKYVLQAPLPSSLQQTSSEKSPAPVHTSRSRKASPPGIGANDFRKRKLRNAAVVPATKVQNVFAANAAEDAIQASPTARRGDEEELVKNADAILRRSKRIGKITDSVEDDLAPPLKKRRRRSTTKNVDLEKEKDAQGCILDPVEHDSLEHAENSLDDEADRVVQLSMTSRSEFVAPSDIKRIGRSNTAKGGKGRGKGNGRPRATTARQKTAELEACKKKLEEQEEKMQQSASENEKLYTENVRLTEENKRINRDNRGLNEQMQRLLQEVQSLRNQISSQPTKEDGLLSDFDPLQTREAEAAAKVVGKSKTTTPKSARSEEIRTLRTKTAGLREENMEITVEKENLYNDLKEAEDEKRATEKLLNQAKNALERQQLECGRLRKLVENSQKDMNEAVSAKEDIETKLKGTEDKALILKSEVEALKLDVMEHKQTIRDESREKAEWEQKVRDLELQIASKNKKLAGYDGKYLQLQKEIEAGSAKCAELQKTAEGLRARKQYLEDKHVEIMAERDTLQSELSNKMQEHEAALQVTSKDKASLEKLRRNMSDGSFEQKRLQRELVSWKKECARLRSRVQSLQFSLKTMMPSWTKFTRHFDQIMKEADEMDRGMAEVVECVVPLENGNVHQATEKPTSANGALIMRESRLRGNGVSVVVDDGRKTRSTGCDKENGYGKKEVSREVRGTVVTEGVPDSDELDEEVDEP